ncbi:MAG: SDR family oxidoreductase [Bacteroidaceae bacterium]|nr:SDR family oxidoreductase [Bacteroidaceae bacterium]
MTKDLQTKLSDNYTMHTVWITGASSGIGRACAFQYAMQGCRLVLTSTSRPTLEQTADRCRELGASDIRILPYDLSEPDGIRLLVNEAWNAYGGIDILFCNAGISQRTAIEDTPMSVVRKIMEVNFFASAAMAQAILPLMISNGGGRIAVTSSIAGKFGFPLRCAYSSSKFALYGFFETLRAENRNRNISVTIICPGRVRTNISFNALDKGGVRHGVMDPGQDGGLSADKAARKIVRAIKRRRNEVLVGRGELLMVYIKRFFPNLCARLAAKIKPM